MNELKTLKEMTKNDDFAYVDELRQEAIKWIKRLKQGNTPYPKSYCNAIEIWVKQFFNISEEDLKDENSNGS